MVAIRIERRRQRCGAHEAIARGVEQSRCRTQKPLAPSILLCCTGTLRRLRYRTIPRTAAEIAVQVVRAWRVLIREDTHHESRRAVAALRSATFDHRLLYRMQ